MNSSNKNNLAIFIGFILIALVGFMTFFKSPTNNPTALQDDGKNKIAEDLKKVKQLTSADLSDKIKNKEVLAIIDVRLEESYKFEHIINSVNIPLPNLNSALASFKKDAAYVIIDDGDSPDGLNMAANIMPNQGFKNVYYLIDGFSGWKNSFYPTISDGDPNSITDQSKIKYIKSADLKNTIAGENNLLIIDIRQNSDYASGHLKNAINIYLDDLEMKNKDIPRGKKILVYGTDSVNSFKGGVRLFDLGFLNVLTLSEGFDALKQNGLEIVK